MNPSIVNANAKWGQKWRSSPSFIVTAMSMALFTDMFLKTFCVPIIPYMLENRIGLDESVFQTVTVWLIAEDAAITLLLSGPVGHYADHSKSKRAWLMWALVIASASTVGMAVATSAVVLFASRAVQASASTVMWVVSYSIIADTIPTENLGKVYGLVSMALSAGTSMGPMISGILLAVGGYWVAWSSAFAFLLFDIILRLLMLERPSKRIQPGLFDSENDPLLPAAHDPETNSTLKNEKNGLEFYTFLLSQPRFSSTIVSYLVYQFIRSSFATTLPLHVLSAFDWGSLEAGLLFVALQGPAFIVSPLVGWLIDRIGTRDPTVIGFATLVPLLWLMGTPGDEWFPWANVGDRGYVIYSLSVFTIGISLTFLNGCGGVESALTIDELEMKHPGVFGATGGYSRALSICNVGYTIGGFVGPILSGYVTDQFGYFTMGCILAGLSLFCAVMSMFCLTSTRRTNRTISEGSG